MSRNPGGGIVQVKTILSDEGNTVLDYLPIRYDYVITDDAVEGSNHPCLTIRCSLESMDQVTSWLETFQNRSHTRWIVGRCTVEPKRFIFRRQWFCHHSCLNKGKTRKTKSTNCKAKIDLKIKKITCDTKKKDEFLRLKPPMPTIIKMHYGHNHTTDFVVRREAFLAHFAETQEQLQKEFVRLRGLISRSKPGLCAMELFLNQLRDIKTEAELFDSMRKVRLKPTVFTRIGRPPKNKLPETKKPPQKRVRTTGRPVPPTTTTTTVLTLEAGTIFGEEDIEFHTLVEEETEQPASIDISYLLTNEPSLEP